MILTVPRSKVVPSHEADFVASRNEFRHLARQSYPKLEKNPLPRSLNAHGAVADQTVADGVGAAPDRSQQAAAAGDGGQGLHVEALILHHSYRRQPA